MRIAFISTMGGGSWGGSEELWSIVAEEALDTNHQVFVSLFQEVASERLVVLEKKGAVMDRRILVSPSASLPGKALSMIKEKLALKLDRESSALFSFKPDTVCINLAGSYDIIYSPWLQRLIKKLTVPYTLICQGHDDIPFATEGQRSIVKELFTRAQGIAFVSQANLRATERHLAVQLPNGFLVNNPANLSSIECLPYSPPAPTLKFANVSRFDTRQKGHDILFETLAKPQWKNRDWTLTLAGSGIHHQYLLDLVDFYGISDKVIFAGQLRDIRAFWKEQHLLLLPSRYEGTPLALIESMLCGRTAVVTDVAGNTEWIGEDNGFIAEAPATKYFEKALEKMWEQRDQLEQLGKKCHDRAKQLFNPDIHKLVLNKLTGDRDRA